MDQRARGFRRVGLFGGSFDPVHTGHLLVAQAALEELELDHLFLVLAARSPFKLENAPQSDDLRLKMLRTAFVGYDRVSVDQQELRRGGVSYSIDTVHRYRDQFPKAQLYYLIGSDHVPTLDQWRNATQLAELVRFAVIPRPGFRALDAQAPDERFQLDYLAGAPTEISSSAIRERVRRGKGLGALTPGFVEEIIRNYRLYL